MNEANRTCNLFPKRLQDTEGPKIFETFGFARLSSGFFLLFTSFWTLLQTSAKDAGSNSVFAISAGIAAAFLLAKDIRQRRWRAVLVLDKESLGLYHQERLRSSVAFDQVAIDQVERLFAWIMLAVFSLLVALALCLVITEREVTTTSSLSSMSLIFGLGMLGLLTVSSLVWTWFACHRVLLLTEHGQGKLMLIRPSSASNLFVRTLATLNFEATVHRCYGFAKPSE